MGFDIEWPFNFQTGSGKTALMQISPNLDECYLFHIFNLKKLPASLIQLLEHPRCRWTGVVVKKYVGGRECLEINLIGLFVLVILENWHAIFLVLMEILLLRIVSIAVCWLIMY